MNKVQHFYQIMTILSTVFLMGTINTNVQGQVCPTNITGFCNSTFLTVNANFDSVTGGVGDCPASITISDGTNTAVLPRFGASCNTAFEAQEAYNENPRSSLFICNTTTFSIDIGTEVCNYTAASGFNNGAILPVELSKFTAYLNQSTILLEWETLMEMNNEYFTVEKSTDGRSFTSVGKLNGAGYSTDERQYMFVDNKPADGRNYYRLKQTDFSGESEYFEVVVVEYRVSGEVTIYPNPVSERMTLNLTGNLIDQSADVAIYSMSSGKLVSLTNVDATDYKLEVNTTDLQAGMYNVVVNIGSQIFNKKFVKN